MNWLLLQLQLDLKALLRIGHKKCVPQEPGWITGLDFNTLIYIVPTVCTCTILISSQLASFYIRVHWKVWKWKVHWKKVCLDQIFLQDSGEQCRYIGSNYLIFLFVFWEITPTNLPQDTFQNNNNLFNFFSRMLHNGSVKGDERPHIFILCNSVLHL